MYRQTRVITSFIFTIILSLIKVVSVAQTGPGGVGNTDGSSGQPENVLWLDAQSLGLTSGTDVSTWTDRSGNGNDLGTSTASGSGVPTSQSGGGIDYLEFNSSEADRLVRRDFSGFPNLNATTFVIFRTNNNGEGIVSYATDGESNEYLIYDAGGLDLYVENQRRSPTGASFNDNSWQIISTRWRSSDGVATLHQAGTAYTVNDYDSDRTLDDGGVLAIGGEQDAVDGGYQTTQDFGGDIAEIIIYDAYLNDAQRAIVENYVSAKYGLALSAGTDFYSGDGSGFSQDVAGIGQTGGEGHTEASSAGFILSSTSLVNNAYLFAGHSNTTNATVTTNLQVGVEERFARTWYVDKTGSFDADLTFDLSEAYPGGQFPQNKNDYVLLRENGGTYDSVAIGEVNKTIVGNKITFRVTDANLADGEYTLGTTDATASPVAGAANKTWYSYQSGNWNDPNVWTLDGSISPLLVNPDNEVPSTIDDVVITSGRTVTMNIDDVVVSSMEVIGRLDVANTSGHDFTTITGSGRIRIAGSSGQDNFPVGDVTGFADATDGGTLEIYGATSFSTRIDHTFNNVEIEMDALANTFTLLRDLTVNGNLTVNSGTFQINDNSAVSSLNVTVYGDYAIAAGTEQRVGTANARHEFNFYGNFTNNGTAYFSQRTTQDTENEATNGIVDANFLADDADQRIDANASTYFYRIMCDKGSDQTYVLDLQTNNTANFVLTGPADYNVDLDVSNDTDNLNALALINGTIKIGTNVVINPLNNTGNYAIGSNARLWIAGGTATKTGGAAVVPYGTIEISEGRIIVTSNSGITTRGTGQFECSGGTVAIPQFRTSILGAGQIGGYQQSGGTVTVGDFSPNADFPGLGLPTSSASANGEYYVFSLTYTGNSFSMSGGTLTIRDANASGLIFINSDPGNVNVTGGTVIATSSNTNPAKITSRAPLYDLTITNSSSNTGAKVTVEGGSSGPSGDKIVLTAQDLVVLNNLTIQTGTTRTSGSNTYGSYLDLCPDGINCVDLEVGRDLTIDDSGVLDVFTSATDNAGSATVTFNGSVNGVFFIGDITGYTNTLTDYDDPGTSTNPYGSYRFPLFSMIIDKPGDTLQLKANGPVNNTSGANVIAGEKNVRGTKSRLLYVRDQFAIRNGATLNQIDPDDDGLGYSMRLYSNTLELDGNLFVYDQGINPTNAFIEFGGGNGTIVINSTATSSIGNIVIELLNDEIELTSDLSVGRFGYRHGGVNLGTYNLKIDVLDLNPEDGGNDDNVRLRTINNGNAQNREFIFGVNGSDVNQFFYTAGNASDGGLSLKVPRQTNIYGSSSTDIVSADPNFDNIHYEYQNRNLLWFPIGVDPDDNGSGTSGRYTPAVAYLHTTGTTSGDEYITVRPVDEELQTTDLSGGDILSYYWNVDFEGYASGEEPTISWLFQYDDNDDDAGSESNYVPGKVLDGGAYTRSNDGDTDAVKDGGNGGEEGDIIGDNPRNIIIFNGSTVAADDDINGVNQKVFNTTPSGGDTQVDSDPTNTNWQSAFPGAGFTLENANYTAGEAARFVGSPTIYYNIGDATYSHPNINIWNDADSWTFNSDHASDAGAGVPGPGDIVYMGKSGSYSNLWIEDYYSIADGDATDTDAQVAEVIFEDTNIRIYVSKSASANFGTVSGQGGFLYFVDDVNIPDVTGDFGDFNSYEDSEVYFKIGPVSDANKNNRTSGIGDNTKIDLTSFSQSEFPRLILEGWDTDANFYFEKPITTKDRLQISYEADFYVTHDVTIGDDLRIGAFKEGRLYFDNSDNSSGATVTVGDDLRIRNDNNSLVDVVSGTSLLEHRLVVNDDIQLEQGSKLDLHDGLSSTNVILEIGGSTSAQLSNADNMPIDLYQLVMNKEYSDSTFTIADNSDDQAPEFPETTTSTYQPLEVLNGILVLNDPQIDWTIADDGADFYLPNTNNLEASSGSGGLEIQQGVVRVDGDDTGIVLDGLLRISGGELDMDDATNNGNNFIQYSSSGNAELEVSSGSLLVGSGIRRSTSNSTGILQYRQTGGTVEIGTQASPLSSRGLFEVVNTGSEFTLTAGSFSINRQNGNNPTVATLLLEPDTYDLAGATINLGSSSTPSDQTITVNSTVSLNNLTVNNISSNAPTARITGRALIVGGDLAINAGAIFDADGWGLTINGDIDTDGTFTSNDNTTIFSGSTAQQITGDNPPTFYNMIKSNTNTLTLNGTDITVANDLQLLSGVLDDGGRTITLQGNMIHDGTHTTSVAGGEGIIFAGTAEQQLTRSASGTSTFGKLTINNGLGVVIPDGNGYNFIINEALRLSAGIFDVGSSLLTIAADASIEEVNSFGTNNMIQTNSSFTDNGVKREFNAITSPTNLNFPVGQSTYSPVNFSITSSDAGSITVRPANEPHPAIYDDLTTTTIDETQNILQYHWILKAENLTNFNATATMVYDEDDVAVTGTYGEDDYIPARIYESATAWDKSLPVSSVNESTNTIEFPFIDVADDNITGDYTAGVEAAIPDDVPVYTTSGNGDFTAVATWVKGETSYPDITEGVGPVGSIIVVEDGHTLTLDENSARVYRTTIEDGGVIEVDGTFGHRLGTVTGSGDIRVISNTSSAVLPAGFYNDFFDCTGGGLEYDGTGSYDILGGITSLRNLTLSGSGTRTLPSNNVTICNNLIVDGPSVENANDRVIIVQNDMMVSGGTYGNGGGSLAITNDLNISGGTFNGSTGNQVISGNLTLSSGGLNVGSDNGMAVRGNVSYSGGTFNGGSGNGMFTLNGNTTQTVNGTFTGTSTFNRLQIDNASGVNFTGNVEVEDELLLDNGLANTNSNTFTLNESASVSPSGGRSNSYVNGRVHKVIASGSSFTFPTGDGNRYGKALVDNVSGGTYTWYAQYYDNGAVGDGAVTNFTPTDAVTTETISRNEYWRIGDNAPTAGTLSANVGLRWDSSSDVSANSADHSELHVVAWNGVSSSWDDHGGTGHSQTTQTFQSSTQLTFSENIVTLGSGSAANPLPVELIEFTAQVKENTVLLNWQTASEINNELFEIQRSEDGKTWEVIGTVDGAGTSTNILHYEFTDANPIIGTSYYRLRQVDFNGKFDYSKIRSVSVEAYSPLNASVVDIDLFPNPTNGSVTLRVSGLAQQVTTVVKLIDIYGKVHQTTKVVSDKLVKGVQLNQERKLPAGLYFIDIHQGSITLQRKLIIR